MDGIGDAQDIDLPPTAKSAIVPPMKRIKILSMGDAKSGKSCLIKRFCEGQFLRDYIPTIGIDYGVKAFQTRLEQVKINFWDVGGDDIYLEIRNEFYKDTNGAFLVFDVSNRSSFENLKKWQKEFIEFSSKDEKVQFALIGNKIDSDRVVGREEGQNLAEEWNAKYYETSAVTGENVQEMFADLFNDSLAAKFKEYAEPAKKPIEERNEEQLSHEEDAHEELPKDNAAVHLDLSSNAITEI